MSAAIGSLDNSVAESAMLFNLRQERIFMALVNPLRIGVGEYFKIIIDQSDVIDVRLAAKFFDLLLNVDLLTKINDVVGVGVNSDDAGKTTGADCDAEYAALPKFFFG